MVIFLWLVGYSVAVETAEVVEGANLWAVVFRPRVAESDEGAMVTLREEEERREDAVVIDRTERAALAVTVGVRGSARRAGRERATDRQAAMVN